MKFSQACHCNGRRLWPQPSSDSRWQALSGTGRSLGFELLEQRRFLNGTAPEALGPVDFLQLQDLNPSSGDLLYRLDTTHDGFLTLKTASAAPADDVALTLFDQSQSDPPLATAAPVDGNWRIDWQVNSGQTYYFTLGGTSTSLDLDLLNLVSHAGTAVTVHGTNASDEFKFNADASRRITINGVQYEFEAESVDSVTFDGGAGEDYAELSGSPGNETAVLRPETATVSSPQLDVTISNTPWILIKGGGGTDVAHLHDSPGSDLFFATTESVVLNGEGSANEVEGFTNVYGYSTAGGSDEAHLFDSAEDDVFIAGPGYAELDGPGGFFRADGFAEVIAYGTAGGTDTASLYDSPDDDFFIANPDKSRLYGATFDISVLSFDTVHAYAKEGGNDTATITGSQADESVGFGDGHGTFDGPGYSVIVTDVESVIVDGKGGYDTANLTSVDPGANDSAELWPNHGTFTSSGVITTLMGIESINIDAGAGKDTVVLHDSPGDDEVYARAVTSYQPVTSITMTDFDFYDPTYVSTYAHALVNFEILTACSTAGIDVASFFDSDGGDEFIGRQYETTLSGEGFNFRAADFAITHGYAKAAGHDTAELYDTPRNDRFKASPTYARMFKGIYQRRAKFFETVIAYADSGGEADRDDARLFDSTVIDQFIAKPTESRLYSDDAEYDITVVSFDAVVARASSRRDTATFIGGSGDDLLQHKWLRADTLVKSPKTEMMDYETKGEVYKITARRFNQTTAQGGQEGFDVAKFWDTLDADRFTADGDTARMYDPADELLYDAIAFDKVVFNHVFGGADKTEKAASYDFLLSEYWAP